MLTESLWKSNVTLKVESQLNILISQESYSSTALTGLINLHKEPDFKFHPPHYCTFRIIRKMKKSFF